MRIGNFALRAEIGSGYASPTRIALGYVIVDRNGRTVERHVGTSLLQPVIAGALSPLQLTIRPHVRSGKYTLRLAVVDAGRVGSVEHLFEK